MITQCGICNKRKEGVTKIKTYNRTFVYACPECKNDMKKTIACMKITVDWMQERTKFNKFETTCGGFAVTPINTTSYV